MAERGLVWAGAPVAGVVCAALVCAGVVRAQSEGEGGASKGDGSPPAASGEGAGEGAVEEKDGKAAGEAEAGGAGKAGEGDLDESSTAITEEEASLLGPTGLLGFGGDAPERRLILRESLAVPDRWRIGWSRWDRYGRQAKSDDVFMNASGGDSPYTMGSPWNPYDRNILKGDYPIIGDDIFLNLSLTSDTLVGVRNSPTPSGVSARDGGRFDFFGDGRAFFLNQNVFLGVDIFKGYTSYRPVDWLIRVAPVFNYNYVRVLENNGVNADVRKGDERNDEFATLQEAFGEVHLGDTSEYFDIMAMKVGRQLFVSDFRGFVFNDISDGVRVFGNAEANKIQWNAAVFNQPEKETNSGLNELNWRDQQVVVANVYHQDFLWKGYTLQGSFHWNHDRSDERYDTNKILVRPPLAGSVTLQEIDAFYLGFAGDGHIGRVNVSHAAYYVFGQDDHNPIAGKNVDIGAFMGAVEVSVDYDWLRPKVSFLYASGDDNATDDEGGGFDAIFDDPTFAGGPSSFYQNQSLRLLGVGLNGARSYYSTLRSSKLEGQANFVNPGTVLFNAGFDAELTPTARVSFNANTIFLADTSTVEYYLNQNEIDSFLGEELAVFAQWRPLLNNNVIFTAGASVLFPGDGFDEIFEDNEQPWQVFTGVTLTY